MQILVIDLFVKCYNFYNVWSLQIEELGINLMECIVFEKLYFYCLVFLEFLVFEVSF